jgi:hypothetical protein
MNFPDEPSQNVSGSVSGSVSDSVSDRVSDSVSSESVTKNRLNYSDNLILTA